MISRGGLSATALSFYLDQGNKSIIVDNACYPGLEFGLLEPHP